MTSAVAFGILKYAGAAYLIYLGVRALLEHSGDLHLAPTRLVDAPLAFIGAIYVGLGGRLAFQEPGRTRLLDGVSAYPRRHAASGPKVPAGFQLDTDGAPGEQG